MSIFTNNMLINNKYAGLILYVSVVIVYVVSLKNVTGFGKHVKKETVESVDENTKVLANFTSYFFTIWNFVIQIIFLVTAIMDESSKLLELPLVVQKCLSRTRAFIFNTLMFPSSLLVMTVFWSLWHFDRELIFPKVIDEFFPSWLNHTLHTFIVVPLIIELILPKKYNFVQFKNAALVLILYTTVYQLLYTSVYLRHGVWLYPIYKTMNWPQRVIFSLLQLSIALVYQKIGIVLQNWKISRREIKIN